MTPPKRSQGATAQAERADEERRGTHGDGAPAPGAPHGLPEEIATLPSADRRQLMRIVEALLFASPKPMREAQLAEQLPEGTDVRALLEDLQAFYAGRGVELARIGGGWMFRTAGDLAYLLERHTSEERRLSKAALETLAIIAYHQPCTRAEIEDVRGVGTSKGTLDALMDIGWVRPRGRRRAPGRPVTYATTDAFLTHFSLDSVRDLPGLSELKGAGLLGPDLPADFVMPSPTEVAALLPDELPLEPQDDETQDELDLPAPLDEDDAPSDMSQSDTARDGPSRSAPQAPSRKTPARAQD